MLIWPNIKCERQGDGQWRSKKVKDLKAEDFTIIEAMLIEKRKLIDEMKRLELGRERLKEYADQLRGKYGDQHEGQKKTQIKISNDIKIMYSPYFKERPVNLILRRSMLKSLATKLWLISEDGCAELPR